MSSLHWPSCFSLVARTGCNVKNGGKYQKSGSWEQFVHGNDDELEQDY